MFYMTRIYVLLKQTYFSMKENKAQKQADEKSEEIF